MEGYFVPRNNYDYGEKVKEKLNSFKGDSRFLILEERIGKKRVKDLTKGTFFANIKEIETILEIFPEIEPEDIDVEIKKVEESNAKFAKRLKELIKERKEIQATVSANTGISSPTISKYCSGKQMPTKENLEKLSKYFNASNDYILGISDYRNVDNDVIGKKTGLNEEAIKKLNIINNGFKPRQRLINKKTMEEIIGPDVSNSIINEELIRIITKQIIKGINARSDLISWLERPTSDREISIKMYKDSINNCKYEVFKAINNLFDEWLDKEFEIINGKKFIVDYKLQ